MKNVDGTFIDYAQFFFPSRKLEEKENAALTENTADTEHGED